MLTTVKNVKAQQLKRGSFSTLVDNRLSRIDQWLLEKIYRFRGPPSNPAHACKRRRGYGTSVLPVATIVIRDRRTLLDLIIDPEAGFGEAYTDGHITVRRGSHRHA